jgi:hypothetical protein
VFLPIKVIVGDIVDSGLGHRFPWLVQRGFVCHLTLLPQVRQAQDENLMVSQVTDMRDGIKVRNV